MSTHRIDDTYRGNGLEAPVPKARIHMDKLSRPGYKPLALTVRPIAHSPIV